METSENLFRIIGLNPEHHIDNSQNGMQQPSKEALLSRVEEVKKEGYEVLNTTSKNNFFCLVHEYYKDKGQEKLPCCIVTMYHKGAMGHDLVGEYESAVSKLIQEGYRIIDVDDGSTPFVIGSSVEYPSIRVALVYTGN